MIRGSQKKQLWCLGGGKKTYFTNDGQGKSET